MRLFRLLDLTEQTEKSAIRKSWLADKLADGSRASAPGLGATKVYGDDAHKPGRSWLARKAGHGHQNWSLADLFKKVKRLVLGCTTSPAYAFLEESTTTPPRRKGPGLQVGVTARTAANKQ